MHALSCRLLCAKSNPDRVEALVRGQLVFYDEVVATTVSGFTAFEDEARARHRTVRAELTRANELAQKIPELERRLADLRAGTPDSPYRAADAAELRQELDVARAGRVERRKLRLEEAALLRQLEAERRRLEAKGVRRITLPLLDDIDIASPCNASWADMDGDTDVRHCGKCMKEVFNLSMMSREEAEALLGLSQGKGLCVRLYRRDDGTVLTQDCPVGERKHRFWRRTKGIAAAGMIAAGLGMIGFHFFAPKCQVAQAGMGLRSSLSPQ